MHELENVGVFSPLMTIAGWNTHGGNSNKTMVLFSKIMFFALKPKFPNASAIKSWVFPTLVENIVH